MRRESARRIWSTRPWYILLKCWVSWRFPILDSVPSLPRHSISSSHIRSVRVIHVSYVYVTCNAIYHISYIYAYVMYIDPSWSYEAWERLSMEHRYCVAALVSLVSDRRKSREVPCHGRGRGFFWSRLGRGGKRVEFRVAAWVPW